MTFAVHCPHCNDANHDPFEVMARGEVDWTLCAGCGERFIFLWPNATLARRKVSSHGREPPCRLGRSGLCCGHCGHRLEFQ